MDPKVLFAGLIATISDLKETPSGPLYAVLMGKCSLDTYNSLLDIMVKMGLIRIKGHVITWIEPTDKTSKAYQMVAGIRQVYAKQTA